MTLTIGGCADSPVDSVVRHTSIPSAPPHEATSTKESEAHWCEPAPARGDDQLEFTVDLEATRTELTIRYSLVNQRPTTVFAVNRIQQDIGSGSPRERHYVIPRTDGAVEISQRAFVYRSPNCVVPRSVPLPPPLGTSIAPGATLRDTVHVTLPLSIQHPEGPSASEHLAALSGPPYAVSFCLGISPTAAADTVDIDGEMLHDGLLLTPETVVCSSPRRLP
ncbi:hypothetical protein ACSVDM_17880 [Nocardia sp. JW2]|uniref:hypothetical protein n=1 Tax=Nocardia sp. JW2 TaxID=3450738 RepID=UPI003F4452EB